MSIQKISTEFKLPWRVVQTAVKDAGLTRPSGQRRMNASAHGYLLTRPPDGKTKFIHRAVMEEKIGRPLEKTEIVHHINGDKQNNEIPNLDIVTRERHAEVHQQLQELGMFLVRANLIHYSHADGYTFSSELERLLNYASERT